MGTAHVQVNKLFIEDPHTLEQLEDMSVFTVLEQEELQEHSDGVFAARCLIESNQLPDGYQGEGRIHLEIEDGFYYLVFTPNPKLN